MIVTNYFVEQDTKEGGHQTNLSTPSAIILHFIRMNPSTFLGTKLDEDVQRFIDEVFKVVDSMGVTLKNRERTYPLINSKMWLKCGYENRWMRFPKLWSGRFGSLQRDMS